MLTKQDLIQIQKLLNPLHTDIKVLKTDVAILKTDVAILKSDVGTLKTDVKNLQKDMTTVKKDIKKIKATVENDFGFHEKQNLHLVKNVQIIQRNLGIPVMTIEPPINNF